VLLPSRFAGGQNPLRRNSSHLGDTTLAQIAMELLWGVHPMISPNHGEVHIR
jgi:hypothetical protein